MKSKNEKSKLNDCPACGMMSFPPIFKPVQKEPVKPTSPNLDPKPNTGSNELGDCPACGMMSFNSFKK